MREGRGNYIRGESASWLQRGDRHPCGPGSVGPGTDGPGTDGPGTDGPGSVGPGTDGPGSVVIPLIWYGTIS